MSESIRINDGMTVTINDEGEVKVIVAKHHPSKFIICRENIPTKDNLIEVDLSRNLVTFKDNNILVVTGCQPFTSIANLFLIKQRYESLSVLISGMINRSG